MNKICIIAYTAGNLRSVANAVSFLQEHPVIITKPEEAKHASHLILPGVGAFGDASIHLHNSGWSDAIKDFIATGKSFLGICLGMQLLATSSLEHGEHSGLNIIAGRVEKIDTGGKELSIPHTGWNDVEFKENTRLFKGLGLKSTFYFLHSYVVQCKNNSTVAGTCEYGNKFAAALEYDNIFATQFHPEKSQKAGLNVLKNFLTAE